MILNVLNYCIIDDHAFVAIWDGKDGANVYCIMYDELEFEETFSTRNRKSKHFSKDEAIKIIDKLKEFCRKKDNDGLNEYGGRVLEGIW